MVAYFSYFSKEMAIACPISRKNRLFFHYFTNVGNKNRIKIVSFAGYFSTCFEKIEIKYTTLFNLVFK